jgi:hypothetical protein
MCVWDIDPAAAGSIRDLIAVPRVADTGWKDVAVVDRGLGWKNVAVADSKLEIAVVDSCGKEPEVAAADFVKDILVPRTCTGPAGNDQIVY